jgi:effector-binding domain-containing protein
MVMVMNATVTYQVSTVRLTDRYTAVVRAELPVDELPAWLTGVFLTARAYLTQQGIEPAGAPFARLAFLGGVVAAEAGFPVGQEIPGDGVVEPSTLPDGPAAVTVHWGRYDDLTHAYQACRDWLADHGLEPVGPHWEVYHTDPNTEPDPARWRTDVVVPFHVKKGERR